MFKIEGTKIQGCCYCDKFKLVKSLFKNLDIKNIEKNINKFKKLESLKFCKEFLFKSKPNKYVVYNHESCKNF